MIYHFPRSRFRFSLQIRLCSMVFFVFTSVQAQDQGDILRIQSNLVQLNVGVVDKQGHAILNLSRNSFDVFENGVKQTIQDFDATDKPFSVVLLLDVSGSTIGFRETFKAAAYRFLDVLSPDDRVEVIEFNEKIKTLSGFTSNRRKTADAIYAADGKGQTEFYQALKFAINELSKEGTRRKAIVVMTDGIDSNLRKSDKLSAANATTDEQAIASVNPEASPELQEVLSAADHRGVTIYPLALPSGDPKHVPIHDPQIIAEYVSARSRLELLANRTGGQITAINRLDEMARVYAIVAADLQALYTIAYVPPSGGSPGWRNVRVEVNQPDVVVRTKTGYCSSKDGRGCLALNGGQ